MVVRASGAPIERATVRLLNLSTGTRRELRADARGQFLFDNVSPGGPYRVEAQAIGLIGARPPADFSLRLGERVAVIVMFSDAARTLDPVIVRSRPRAEDAGGGGGPAVSLPAELVHGLPLFNRDFVGLFKTIPQAVGRTLTSIGGQSQMLNAIQIDGGTASNVYGVGLTPGSNAGAKAVSLEALDEIRVLIAPFDVRQSTFTGGLINAVTRSGTNEWRGEVFTSLQRPSLVGPDTAHGRANDFEFLQYGATLGGPVLKDRLHLFVAGDLQRSRTAYVGPALTDTTTGIGEATAARAAAAFRTRYGLDAGTAAAPILTQPDRSVFAKLSWSLSSRHSIDVWHQEIRAHEDDFSRDSHQRNNRDGWILSRSGLTTRTSVGSSRLRASSLFGAVTNELIAGEQSSDDVIASWLTAPLFLIQGDVAGNYLGGGGSRNGQGTTLGQSLREVTDNVSWRAGDHDLTVGAHAEWFRVRDKFFPSSWGVWKFPSIDAFEAGRPDRYEINLPLRDGGPVGAYHAAEYAAYAQDRWAASRRLAVTGGLRLDVPYNAAPAMNAALAADPALHSPNTANFPTGNSVLSPRFAVNWLVDEKTDTRLRLGAGVFTARPPYAWFGQAFINTGLDQATLVCTVNEGVPAPVIDLTAVPTRCVNASLTPPPATVTYFSPRFRFPRVRKFLAGMDREIGDSWAVSADFLHTYGVDAVYVADENLVQIGTNAEGRAMYGTLSSTGLGRPTRPDSILFTQVFQYRNRSGDRSTAVSIALDGHWGDGARLQLGYQWMRARDAIITMNPTPMLAFQNAPIDGTIADRRMATSLVDAPHSFTATGIVPLPGRVTIAIAGRAQAGRPFSYVTLGDANADGVSGNDLIYLPSTAAEISLTDPTLYDALDRFIEGEPCLRSQRGRVVARNSCRNPSFISLDTRITKSLPRQLAEVSVDIFNLPNLLRGSWGLVRETSSRPQLELLRVAGWDAAANRPRYAVPVSLTGSPLFPSRAHVLVDVSRWRIQLGARVRFSGSRATAATSESRPGSP